MKKAFVLIANLTMVAMLLTACQGATVEVTQVVTQSETIIETVKGTVVATVLDKDENVMAEAMITATPPVGGVFAGAVPYSPPPVGHFNPPVTNALVGGFYRDLMYLPLGMHNWADGTWSKFLAEDWGFQSPNAFQVKLRQGVQWSDGSSFTTRDVVTSYNIARLMNHTVWRFLDHLEIVDDHTINFIMSTPSTVVERYVIRGMFQPFILSTSLFGEWSDRVQALVAAGLDHESQEWQTLLQEFNAFRPEEMVVTGPYKLDPDSINEDRLTLIKNDRSYLADTVKFDRIYLYNGDTPSVTPLVLTQKIDYATHGFPPATERAFQTEGIRLLRPPYFSGPALYFNHTIYPFNVKAFRQALAYAIDRDENAVVSLGASAKAQQHMVGFSDNIVPRWLSEAEIAQLNPYAYDPVPAAALLEELGFTKGDDGVWISDRGDRMEYELIAPAEFADWSAGAENLAEQLTAFGVKTTFRAVSFQRFGHDVHQGDFELALHSWGAGDPHPHFAYRQNLFAHNIEAVEGPGMSFPMTQLTDAVGEIDLEEEVLTSVEGLDETQQKVKIARLALAYNELLPQIPLWERYGNNPALDGLHTCGWKPEGDPIYKNHATADSFVVLMILDGTLYPCNQ